jgi:heptosyltransferase-2
MKFSAKKSFNFSKNYEGHQVEKYNKFVDNILGKKLEIYPPKLYFTPFKYQKPTLGINPGATYGSAKRWYPDEFAKVANQMAKEYDIIIFGGPGEEDIAKDIEKNLTIKNYQNLCAKLSIQELCEKIAGLSMFVTNDSGPMHIAAAYNVPIVAIFGPTKFTETSPYSKNYKIVTKNLECAPCMKRECPLKTHECMKEIKADEVIKAIKELNESLISG